MYAHCGRCWVDHVNAARVDAVAGAGWRAVAAQLQAAIRAAAAEADAAGARLTDELNRALGRLLHCPHVAYANNILDNILDNILEQWPCLVHSHILSQKEAPQCCSTHGWKLSVEFSFGLRQDFRRV